MTVVVRATDPLFFDLLCFGWSIQSSYYYGRVLIHIMELRA